MRWVYPLGVRCLSSLFVHCLVLYRPRHSSAFKLVLRVIRSEMMMKEVGCKTRLLCHCEYSSSRFFAQVFLSKRNHFIFPSACSFRRAQWIFVFPWKPLIFVENSKICPILPVFLSISYSIELSFLHLTNHALCLILLFFLSTDGIVLTLHYAVQFIYLLSV